MLIKCCYQEFLEIPDDVLALCKTEQHKAIVIGEMILADFKESLRWEVVDVSNENKGKVDLEVKGF